MTSYLEDLKAELIQGQRLAVDEEATVLVWTRRHRGGAPPATAALSAGLPARAPLAYTPRTSAEKILTSRSALEGERKQVTVLFADVAGFTTLAEQLDPEIVHDLINRCFERITAEVHRFEGTINQYTGDGVMALFGAPIAHEDSPRRAVHAALGIQRAIRDVRPGAPGRARAQLADAHWHATPAWWWWARSVTTLRMDYAAVGDTTNLAARLQQSGPAGERGDQRRHSSSASPASSRCAHPGEYAA